MVGSMGRPHKPPCGRSVALRDKAGPGAPTTGSIPEQVLSLSGFARFLERSRPLRDLERSRERRALCDASRSPGDSGLPVMSCRPLGLRIRLRQSANKHAHFTNHVSLVRQVDVVMCARQPHDPRVRDAGFHDLDLTLDERFRRSGLCGGLSADGGIRVVIDPATEAVRACEEDERRHANVVEFLHARDERGVPGKLRGVPTCPSGLTGLC